MSSPADEAVSSPDDESADGGVSSPADEAVSSGDDDVSLENDMQMTIGISATYKINISLAAPVRSQKGGYQNQILKLQEHRKQPKKAKKNKKSFKK